jgi:outer membrane protein assembly factor BamB
MRGTCWRTGALGAGVTALVLLAGCAGDGPSLPKLSELNPFAEKAVPLPGRRIPVMQTDKVITGELSDASQPIVLPAPSANQDWAQPGGNANNAPGHLAFDGAVSEAWSADAGTGSSSSGRLTAPPIVYNGTIYTLDAVGMVSAFSTSGGSSIWHASLKPNRESASSGSWFSFSLGGGGEGSFGGGIAADNGRLYAASGFGNVVAFDPQSGRKLWEKQMEAPIRAAPTAAGDRVYVVTLDGRFYCLAGADGGELWSVRGLPQQASLINNASPAVDGGVVVVPYPSGDLVALNVADGTTVWSESLSRTRTTSQLTSMSDAARPAIDNGTVFAVGHAGRMVATQTASGERLWSINVPGTQQPWVAGNNVFVVDTSGELIALSRNDGKILWTTKLPQGSWAGPTLAGGMLWLASAKGELAGVDAATGRIATQKDLGTPVYVPPIVAQGRMYILTDNAKLLAFN